MIILFKKRYCSPNSAECHIGHQMKRNIAIKNALSKFFVVDRMWFFAKFCNGKTIVYSWWTKTKDRCDKYYIFQSKTLNLYPILNYFSWISSNKFNHKVIIKSVHINLMESYFQIKNKRNPPGKTDKKRSYDTSY